MHENILDKVRRRRDAIGHLLNSYAFNKPIDRYHQFCQRVDELNRALSMVSAHTITLAQTRHEALLCRLTALDPDLTLKRGYAIVLKDGRIVRSRTGVAEGDQVRIRFSDGTVRSRIEE